MPPQPKPNNFQIIKDSFFKAELICGCYSRQEKLNKFDELARKTLDTLGLNGNHIPKENKDVRTP
jgi:hypothetical protein